jgi:hypothetical protein
LTGFDLQRQTHMGQIDFKSTPKNQAHRQPTRDEISRNLTGFDLAKSTKFVGFFLEEFVGCFVLRKREKRNKRMIKKIF